jgi:hypothetical protein
MTGRENEIIAINPARLVGIIFEGVPPKHGTHFRASEWKSQVARLRRLDRVHAKAARLSCGLGKNFEVQTHVRLLNRQADKTKQIPIAAAPSRKNNSRIQ